MCIWTFEKIKSESFGTYSIILTQLNEATSKFEHQISLVDNDKMTKLNSNLCTMLGYMRSAGLPLIKMSGDNQKVKLMMHFDYPNLHLNKFFNKKNNLFIFEFSMS